MVKERSKAAVPSARQSQVGPMFGHGVETDIPFGMETLMHEFKMTHDLTGAAVVVVIDNGFQTGALWFRHP